MLVALLLVSCLAACGTDPEEPADSASGTDTAALAETTPPAADTEPAEPDTEPDTDDENKKPIVTANTLVLNASAQGIRLLGGRTLATDKEILCDQAGSGVEFTLINSGKTLTFSVETDGPCYFRVYVNGAVANTINGDELHFVDGKGMVMISGLKGGEQKIRLIKVSGADTATAQLTSVLYTGVISKTAPKGEEGYLEFVGGTLPSDDVTLSDAFALAKACEAEYSILSELSLLCGETDLSAAYAQRSSERDNTAYGFDKKAKVVIVDLGAADYALSKTDSTVTAEAFAEKYQAMIETIIENNSETDSPCRVVCVYDAANEAFADAVTAVYEAIGKQSAGIYVCTRNSGEDGVMSSDEQTAYLKVLKNTVAYAEAGMVTDKPLENGGTDGTGLSVSYKDFVKK